MSSTDPFIESARREGLLSEESEARLMALHERHRQHPMWQLALAAGLVSPKAAEGILAEAGQLHLVCSICGSRTPRQRFSRTKRFKKCPTCKTALVPCTHAVWSFPALEPDEIEKDPLVGATIGPYRIDTVIGTGGMADVYRATSLETRRACAIKVLAPALLFGDEERYLLTFLAQSRKIAQFRHPHIIRIWAVEEHGGMHLVIMEYLSHGNLIHTLRDRRRLPVAEALHVVQCMAKALAYSHERDVVHMDVKPENILFTATDAPKLTDFSGIIPEEHPEFAERIQRWVTPTFMSPEQAAHKAIDARSDIYSLGLVWATMVAGRRPYFDTPRREITKLKATEPCPLVEAMRDGLPAGHFNVLQKMCELYPDDRYPSMKACIRDLQALSR